MVDLYLPTDGELFWDNCEGNELQMPKGDECWAEISPHYQVNHSILPRVAIERPQLDPAGARHTSSSWSPRVDVRRETGPGKGGTGKL